MIQVYYLRLVVNVDDDAPVTRQELETKMLSELEGFPRNYFPMHIRKPDGDEYGIELADFEIIPPQHVKLENFEPSAMHSIEINGTTYALTPLELKKAVGA
jgi:hypothetical protein